MIAGVMTLCFGAAAPSCLAIGRARIGNADDDQSQRHHGTDRAGHDQRAETSDRRDERGHDRGRHRAAEEARKGVDRKRTAHPRFIHMRRQDRVIAGVIDAVGEPEQRGADDQRGVAQVHAEHDQRQAADGEPDQQDFSGADMVGEIADRRLRQAGHHAEYGQRKTELDIADAELHLQERKQHRQHEQMEMADPMGDRNRRERAQRGVRLGLLRCGQNIDHVGSKPRMLDGPARATVKIVASRYLSMNAGAWLPRRRAGTRKLRH